MATLEELVRININRQLIACGWIIQDMVKLNRYISPGVILLKFSDGEI
jgi:hypothetical protein